MKFSPSVVLKQGRDIHAKNKHPWIFLGAVESFPDFTNGDILPVSTSEGVHVGYAYFNRGQSIVGRMLSFTDEDPLESVRRNIARALELRASCITNTTTAYRLINGEGDNLPGLIVDRYGEVLVVQINTLGMEKLKPLITEVLISALSPKALYEKSSSSTRKKEGLPNVSDWLYHSAAEPVHILEHGLTFSVSLSDGQKTGFFLDQREMRKQVRQYAHGRTLLNCFAYTGGFSIYALAGGAQHVDTVDSDRSAIAMAEKNATLNGFTENHTTYAADVFKFLGARELPQKYDFIILDPPAFAKRASDIKNASRGYREINRLAMQHLPSNGLLLTASCSSHIDRHMFQTIIFQAAKDAKRDIKIIGQHILAPDHPVNLFFPEGDYLKSLLLVVS